MLLPVILVHGIFGSPAIFAPMQLELQKMGYEVHAPQLPGQDNFQNAGVIKALVDSLHSQVHLVGFSMGGLSARWYAKYIGTDKVASFASLDVPQHGSWLFFGVPDAFGGQVFTLNPLIVLLNWGDETPGPGRWLSVVNSHGFADSGLLSGSTVYHCELDHPVVPTDMGVINAVIENIFG